MVLVVALSRRSALGAVLVLLLSWTVLISSAKPAEAFVPAVFAYPAATSLLTGAAATGPVGWVTAGTVVVGVGAWYAYSNREEIASWMNDRFSSPSDGVQEASPEANHVFGVVQPPDADWPVIQFQWGPGASGRATSLNFRVRMVATCRFGSTYVPTNQALGYLSDGAGGLLPPINFGMEAHFDSCVASGGVPHSWYAYRESNNATLGTWVNPSESAASRSQAKQECLRANGTTFTVTGTETLSQSQPAAVKIPSCSAVEPGTIGTKVDLCSRSAGGADNLKCASSVAVDKTKLQTGGAFQDCGPGHSPCELQVKLNGTPCQVGMTGCVDWYTKLGTAYQTNYSCMWGPYTVTLQDCRILKDHYREDAVRDDTGLGQAPGTDPGGETGGDTGGLPSTGTNELPANGPDLPEDFGSCMGEGWSWNPVSWVYVPTRCALSWAFVPSETALQTEFSTVNEAWSGTRVPEWGEWAGSVGSAFSGFGSGTGGCAGPHFEFTLSGESYAFDPLNACSAPMSGVAVVVKLFVTIFAILLGFRLVMRPVSHAVGMGGASE